MRELTAAARSFEDDGDTSVVVLTSGAKAFSAVTVSRMPKAARARPWISAPCAGAKLGPQLSHARQGDAGGSPSAPSRILHRRRRGARGSAGFSHHEPCSALRVPEIGLGMNMSWQNVPRMLHLIGMTRTKQAVILAELWLHQRRGGPSMGPGGGTRRSRPGVRRRHDFGRQGCRPAAAVGRHDQADRRRLTHVLDDLTSHMDVDRFGSSQV